MNAVSQWWIGGLITRKAKVVGSIPAGGSITCSNKAAQERVIDFIPRDLPELLLIHRVEAKEKFNKYYFQSYQSG